MPELSVFDERLAEIDRRLRSIQSELDADLAPGGPLDPEDAPERPGVNDRPGAIDGPGATGLAESSVPEHEVDRVAALPAPTPLRGRAFATPPAPSVPPPPSMPSRPPSPAGSDSPPATLSPPVLAELRELRAAHERLLELHGELLGQYAETLERRTAGAGTATVTAGPFADPATLRDFERRLAALPGVDAVTVREFLGADRVALDVRLA